MKFMILVKSNPDLEARLDAMSEAQMKNSMAAMEVFNDELKKAGVLKDCDGLRLTREAKRVRFDGDARTVADGPFTGDLVAGYWLWELPSTDDADMPGFSVFTRRDGSIRHFWSGEMGGGTADPGQDPRGAPDLMPLWTILDNTPEGRGADWYPSLNYGPP